MIKTIKWWEYILLAFKPSHTVKEEMNNCTLYIRYKYLFTKIYVIDEWQDYAKGL